MILRALRGRGQVFYSMLPHLGLFGVFLMMSLGLWAWGKNPTEVNILLITSYLEYMMPE